MELVTPGIGLIFWMTLSFLFLILILKKYAWKPILKMLRDRENKIDEALHEADKAREEMKQLKFSNEQLLKEAKEERDDILRSAREVKEKIIEDARARATEEAANIVESAKQSIHFEKMQALTELKNQIAILSIEIAEKLIQEDLDKKLKQENLVEKLINKIDFN